MRRRRKKKRMIAKRDVMGGISGRRTDSRGTNCFEEGLGHLSLSHTHIHPHKQTRTHTHKHTRSLSQYLALSRRRRRKKKRMTAKSWSPTGRRLDHILLYATLYVPGGGMPR